MRIIVERLLRVVQERVNKIIEIFGKEMKEHKSEVVVYYVFKNGEKICNGGFLIEDAIKYAKEIDADEVEAAIWYSRDSYINYELADEFETVWER